MFIEKLERLASEIDHLHPLAVPYSTLHRIIRVLRAAKAVDKDMLEGSHDPQCLSACENMDELRAALRELEGA